MKLFKKSHRILFLLWLITLYNCVENDSFNNPSIEDVPFIPNAGDIIMDISAVIGEYAQQNEIFTFDALPNPENSRYMIGYVISSDEGGNLFKEIVLQDSPSNPTSGIVVQVDTNPLYTFYEFGRKVFIRLDGLSVGEENGILQIGKREGNHLEKIPTSLRNKHIIRDVEVATIIPLELNLDDLTSDKENLFIRLNDVQFHRDDVLGNRPLTFASELSDEFDGERTIESCTNNYSITLSTSTFSDFKALSLPINQGSIDGIISRDFFDNFCTLVINSPDDINFTSDTRCDPIALNCGLAPNEGMVVLFEDDFETQNPSSLVSGNGWTNFIQEGTEGFETYISNGTNASLGTSVRIGSYNPGDPRSIAWLITSQINLDVNSGVTLSFQSSNSFSDNSTLELLFSNDWNGDITTINSSTWGLLSDAYIVEDSDSFSSWFNSGIVDLSCGNGSIYIAFRYLGSGATDSDGTFELDNIKISAN
ncbi:MAG: choice-of-anchor J domain-containing protein [Flavobacteriaceae bacterium]|nr:choice-of-anchor J domain-containing protein [Flavobacteriaceae bacterium]